MSEENANPRPDVHLDADVRGNGRSYQVGYGNLNVNNSTHYYGQEQASPHPLTIERPDAWEYLYYASVLKQCLAELQGKWLAYCFGDTVRARNFPNQSATLDYFAYVLKDTIRIVESMASWLSPALQERAFGRPGESGDPIAIEHGARGLCRLFGEWIDLAIELRSITISSDLSKARKLLLDFGDVPLREGHEFIEGVIRQFEEIPRLLAEHVPGQQIVINSSWELTLDAKQLKEYNKEIKRLRRAIR